MADASVGTASDPVKPRRRFLWRTARWPCTPRKVKLLTKCATACRSVTPLWPGTVA